MNDRETLDHLFCAALAAVDPFLALMPHLVEVQRLHRSGDFHRIVVAGFGKGALPMALAAEEVLGDAIDSGLIIVPHGSRQNPQPSRIEVASAGHPHPDHCGEAASRRILELAQGADGQTLLLLLVSGGGSALFTAPAAGI